MVASRCQQFTTHRSTLTHQISLPPSASKLVQTARLSFGSPAPSWHLASSSSTSPSSPMRDCISMHRLEGPVFGPEDETWEWVEEGDRIGVVAGWERDDESVDVKVQEFFDVERGT